MESTTASDLSALLVEDNRRELTELLKPLVEAAVSSAFNATIMNKFGDWFDALTKTQQEWRDEFVKANEERIASLATKDELTGVIKSGAENTERLAKTEARLTRLEADFKTLMETDKKRSAEISEIKSSASITATNAQKTSEAVVDLIGQFKSWRADTDREVNAMKDAQKADQKAIREAQEDILNTRSIVNDAQLTVATQTEKALNKAAALADKVTGLDESHRALHTAYVALDARQEATEKEVVKYGVVYRMIGSLERHPKIGGALVGAFFLSQGLALYFLFRIAVAGLQISN
jgi:chromosome segregation ATPase